MSPRFANALLQGKVGLKVRRGVQQSDEHASPAGRRGQRLTGAVR